MKAYLRGSFVKLIISALLIVLFLNFGIEDEGTICFVSKPNLILYSFGWLGVAFWLLKLQAIRSENEKHSIWYFFIKGMGCLMFSAISAAGRFYVKRLPFRPYEWIAGGGSFAKSAVIIIGGTLFFWYLMNTIGIIILQLGKDDSSDKIPLLDQIVGGRHVFSKCCLFITVLWIPQIVIRYPGAMTIDGWTSLYQYWNPEKLTNQHPILYTLLLGKLADKGLVCGHIEYGLFMIVLVQVLIHILVFAYCLSVMRMFNVNKFYCFIALLFFFFFACFPGVCNDIDNRFGILCFLPSFIHRTVCVDM